MAAWDDARAAGEAMELCLVGLRGEALAATADHLVVLRAGRLAAGRPHGTLSTVHPLADLAACDAQTGVWAGSLVLRLEAPDGTPAVERVAFARRDADRFRLAGRMLLRMAAAAATRRPRAVRAAPTLALPPVAAAAQEAPPDRAGPPVEDSVRLLRALSQLAQEGLISAAEHDAKRREILARL
jgi:hypothetical protein